MLGSTAEPAHPATAETTGLQSASSSHRSRDTETAATSLHICSEPCTLVRPQESHGVANDTIAPERTAVEKIHLLPVSREAPKAWVFASLTGLMKEGKTVRQYLYLKVRRPANESKNSKTKTVQEEQRKQQQQGGHQQQGQGQQQQQQQQRQQQQQSGGRSISSDASNDEYTYIVVACLPHSGVITSSTVVFTSGSPLQPLRRVQLLALIHPNSAYARRAGVASYSEALHRGVVGEFSTSGNTNTDSRSDQRNVGICRLTGDAAGTSESSSSSASSSRSGTHNSGGAPFAAGDAAHRRRQLGSPFDWGTAYGTDERRRRRQRPQREYNRAEEVIAAVLDDSDHGSGLGEDESGDEDEMGGGLPFRLGDSPEPEESDRASLSRGQQQQGREDEHQGQEQGQRSFRHQRTLQLNFNFSPSCSGGQNVGGRGSECSEARLHGNGAFSLSEEVLFHDFVAPYFRARSGGASLPPSPGTAADGGSCRDTAVVVFPGKKLVIKDLTFVVWATDPGNGPGFVWKDTAIYISVDPWGEYRRVHILPFADTLPTTYSFRLFEDYLQPFLKEQPWRLIRKGDIFTFRGVEFKVIATEPATVPVARVGPETVVHFDGSLNPSLIDVLPPEILSRVRRLPARVQPFAIVAAAQSLDPQLLLRVLPSGGMRGGSRGIDEGLEAAVKRQLVGPFCFAEYRRLYSHLCTRSSPEDTQKDLKQGTRKASGTRNAPAVATREEAEQSQSSTSALSAEGATGGGDLEAPCCTVCTLQLQDGTESVTLTCGHAFHWECARAWLRCSATCPNCRAQVVLPSGPPREGGGASDSAQTHAGNTALGFVRNAWTEFFST
ncbi:hypothetical protein, conserved [Eimeria praecox]|uniref:RING-type E3 ubiquitin transferase n=1 Tax=Eimeria praecox TaxID=51316 RepID=U6GRA2_9EIME|nr:hypothetical protein, conserved [Eimeria praecox]